MNLRQVAQDLVDVEVWGASLAVLVSMVVVSWLPWMGGILLLFWLLRLLAWGKIRFYTLVDVPVLVLLLVMGINYWISPIPEKTLPQSVRLLLGIGLFYAIVNWVNAQVFIKRKPAKDVLIGLAWSLVVLTLGLGGFAFISVVWVDYKIPFIPASWYATLSVFVTDSVHPNVMAGTLILFLPILFGLVVFALREFSLSLRLGLVFAIMVGVVVLLLTQSRGAIVTFVIVLVGILCLRWRWGWLLAGVCCVFIGWGMWKVGIERVLDAVLVNATLSGIGGRTQIWNRAIYMIQDFPITGVGMGLFGDVADAFYPFTSTEPGQISHTHQLFLQVAVDLGVPGFIAWLTILVLVLMSAFRLYKKGLITKKQWVAGFGAGLLGSQMALCLHGLVDAVTWGMVRPAPFVWGIWGLTIAASMAIEDS